MTEEQLKKNAENVAALYARGEWDRQQILKVVARMAPIEAAYCAAALMLGLEHKGQRHQLMRELINHATANPWSV